MLKNKDNLKMTEGSIPRLLVAFAIPLFLGNVFQQLYNMVDTWVVGNFVSNEAFSAVGTVGPIINTLLSLFIGLSSGAGVVIAQYYGAGREEEARRTVHTAILMTVVLAVLMTALGILLRGALLHLMNTPEEVLPDARRYLAIFFAGITGLFFYNIGASILQAIGDSKRPFYFLATAAMLNIAGDLILVLRFDMGVSGVALATVFAMGVSALLMIGTLIRTKTCVQLRIRYLRPDWKILGQIFRMGIPASIQMGIISFSNIIVQGYINYFGADVMSGWTAYAKIDALMLLPIQSVALATTTFVGQNIGSGDVDRARKGVRTATVMSILMTVLLSVPVLAFAPAMVGFFNPKAEVIAYGTLILRLLTPFYFIAGSANIQNAGLRGAGDARAPMVISILCYVVFRQIYLFTVSHFVANELIPIAFGYPAGWLLCSLITGIYFHKADIGSRAVTGKP